GHWHRARAVLAGRKRGQRLLDVQRNGGEKVDGVPGVRFQYGLKSCESMRDVVPITHSTEYRLVEVTDGDFHHVGMSLIDGHEVSPEVQSHHGDADSLTHELSSCWAQ